MSILIFASVIACALYALGIIDIRQPENKTKEYSMGEYTLTYNGTMLNGKFEGSGKIEFSDGDIYDGSFAGGRFNGNGSYYSAEGWRYEGEFEKGEMTGAGVFFGKDGESLGGVNHE